jgi:2,5-diketo-D-gluconate reductase B
LRRALPFGIAFAAGYLFGRRSGPDEGRAIEIEEDEPDATAGESGPDEQASEVGSDEQVGAGEPAEQAGAMGAGEREPGTATVDEATAAETTMDVSVDEEVAALSAPTTRGMPMLGLGTYQMDEYEECFRSVLTALEMGYRHVDTAQGYENEEAVGDAIAAAGVPREDVFVATKVTPDNLAYDHVIRSTEESLERLGLDYVDLLYVHWPTGEYEPRDTLDAFAELREEGLIEEIGVSNFTVDLLEEAVDVAEEPVFADQVEMHPLLPQEDLREFCGRDDVDVELVAYSPVARGDVDDVAALQDVAEQHDATPAQVALAWLREKGVTAIPKATSREHLRENWLSLDVELDDEDVATVDDIGRTERLVDPDVAPWNE